MTIEIKDTKGKVTLEAKFGHKKIHIYKLKVDQKNKTLESEKGGNDKVKYKIEGDVRDIDLSVGIWSSKGQSYSWQSSKMLSFKQPNSEYKVRFIISLFSMIYGLLK